VLFFDFFIWGVGGGGEEAFRATVLKLHLKIL